METHGLHRELEEEESVDADGDSEGYPWGDTRATAIFATYSEMEETETTI